MIIHRRCGWIRRCFVLASPLYLPSHAESRRIEVEQGGQGLDGEGTQGDGKQVPHRHSGRLAWKEVNEAAPTERFLGGGEPSSQRQVQTCLGRTHRQFGGQKWEHAH